MAGKKGPNLKKMSVENKEILLHYGNLIHKYRKDSSYSRIDVCEKVDISNSQLSAWEHGKAEPRLHSMLKICELLNIPLEELFFDVKSREMTAEELKIIKMLRDAPDKVRDQIIGLLSAIISHNTRNEPIVHFPENTEPISTSDSGTVQTTFSSFAEKSEEIIEAKNDENTIPEKGEPQSKKKRGRPRTIKKENPTPISDSEPAQLDGPIISEEYPEALITEDSENLPNDLPVGYDVTGSDDLKTSSASDIQASGVTKRKRGRPRKKPLLYPSDEPQSASKNDYNAIAGSETLSSEMPGKKKRGRPRKSAITGK